jgi:hypothetical protein
MSDGRPAVLVGPSDRGVRGSIDVELRGCGRRGLAGTFDPAGGEAMLSVVRVVRDRRVRVLHHAPRAAVHVPSALGGHTEDQRRRGQRAEGARERAPTSRHGVESTFIPRLPGPLPPVLGSRGGACLRPGVSTSVFPFARTYAWTRRGGRSTGSAVRASF